MHTDVDYIPVLFVCVFCFLSCFCVNSVSFSVYIFSMLAVYIIVYSMLAALFMYALCCLFCLRMQSVSCSVYVCSMLAVMFIYAVQYVGCSVYTHSDTIQYN
jgi:hypothetical protein